MMEILIIPLILVISYFIGFAIEKNHFKSLRIREEKNKHKPFLSEPLYKFRKPVKHSEMACEEIVIGGDYFRHFWANLRNLFGGNLTAYESLKDRARREAILRIKESNPNADYFVNAKIETININSHMCEVLVYVTAIYLEK